MAHWLGSTPYDDDHTPRDHLLTAILTMGEGYHNFHHQFPIDYRNGILWYQYDPTKWFIALCGMFGFANHLRVFPSNEIAKGSLAMKLKDLKKVQDELEWPTPSEKLPVVTWDTCAFKLQLPTFTAFAHIFLVQDEAKIRPLILISGYIHDVSKFFDKHPGGAHILEDNIGKDATTAFFGGYYSHSNAAQNVSALRFSI